MEQAFDLLLSLQNMYAREILFSLGGLLILIDYIFPTDVPAHFGYVCIAAAVFFSRFLKPDTSQILTSLGIAIAVWIVLAILHRLLFRRFLENAPGTEGDESPEPNAV